MKLHALEPAETKALSDTRISRNQKKELFTNALVRVTVNHANKDVGK